ncbi:MAG: hypothetical protein IM568_02475 [Flavobacterium sp.]|nr:hypothetical protein [Flavobacterium sp.]
MAFSSVSMGNTIAVEDAKSEKECSLKVTPSCDQERLETYNDAIANGASHYQAYFQAAGVYMECIRFKGLFGG